VKHLSYALPILVATTLFAADEKSTSDKEMIQGTWVVVSVEEAGQWRSGEVGLKAVFTTDTLTFQRDKQDPMQMKYKLDSTQKPKAIDTTHEIDLGKLILQLGVYSLDGDTLKLRLESAGKPRPDKLETKAKDTSVLFVAKRAKNKAGR